MKNVTCNMRTERGCLTRSGLDCRISEQIIEYFELTNVLWLGQPRSDSTI